MMKNAEIIRKLKESTFTDEDGENYMQDFEEGLSDKEIDDLSKSFPNNTIDIELQEILKETKGWDGYGLEQVRFDSIGEFGFYELSPNSITLGHDGFGNFWILDILINGNLGHVYYACHDPAVLIKYSESLNDFLNSLIEFYESPSENYLNKIHNETVYDIWRDGGKISEKEEFEKTNKDFKSFLGKFIGNDWVVADLRKAIPKDGFALGKFGSNSFTKRHPEELVWVIKKKKKGFLKRLFG